MQIEAENEKEALIAVARAIHMLGTWDAATSMGALEVVAMEIKEGTERIAESNRQVASALSEIAEALRKE